MLIMTDTLLCSISEDTYHFLWVVFTKSSVPHQPLQRSTRIFLNKRIPVKQIDDHLSSLDPKRVTSNHISWEEVCAIKLRMELAESSRPKREVELTNDLKLMVWFSDSRAGAHFHSYKALGSIKFWSGRVGTVIGTIQQVFSCCRESESVFFTK